jgi:hypothetical protein
MSEALAKSKHEAKQKNQATRDGCASSPDQPTGPINKNELSVRVSWDFDERKQSAIGTDCELLVSQSGLISAKIGSGKT